MTFTNPLNWTIVPLIMALTLIILAVIMWWQLTPRFPVIKSANSSLLLKKQWSWW